MKKIYLLLFTLTAFLFAQNVMGQVVIFSENIGAGTGTESIATTVFENSGNVDITISGENIDTRDTSPSTGYDGASGGKNVFFSSGSTVERIFQIEGINTFGYEDIQLTIGHRKGTNASSNELLIEVSDDGDNWTQLSYSRPSGTGTVTWLEITPTGVIPITENLRLRFRKEIGVGIEFRIDDIVLTGTDPTAPNITLDLDLFNGAFGNVEFGSESASSSFDFDAVNLTNDLVINAPSGFKLSEDDAIWEDEITLSDATYTDKTIYVSFVPTVDDGAAYADNITLTSTGATTRTVAVSGQEACVFPASQVSALNASTITETTADVTWTDPVEGAQVIIVVREGSAVNFTPARGTTYTANADFSAADDLGDGNKIVFAGNTTVETTGLTGLSPFTTYHVQAFVYDETNECYNTTAAPTHEFTTDASTDDNSTIEAPATQVAATELISNFAVGDFAPVLNFDITDAGTSDGEPTIVNKVVVEAGASNEADFSTRIANARLIDLNGAGEGVITATVNITASTIEFTIADGDLNVPDGLSMEIQLQILLEETLTDGEQLQFQIPAEHGFEAAVAGSVFSTPITAIVGNIHTIDVVATALEVTGYPTSFDLNLNNDFGLTVTAKDDFGNVDLAARDVSLTVGTGAGNITPTDNLVDQAMTDGVYAWSGLSYSEVGTFTLSVTDGTLSIESDEITVSEFIADFTENFDNSSIATGYGDGSFLGNNGITWSYYASRDGNNDANGSGINLPALMLRRVADNSRIESSSIPGGISTFAVKLYKGFTGGGNRQVELFVNGISKGTSTPFDNFDEQVFLVENIDVTGAFTIEIRNITATQVIIDDIQWTSNLGCTAPTTQASAAGFSNITSTTADANWTLGNGDRSLVVIREGSAVTFFPETGVTYTADQDLGDGHFVSYVGDAATTALADLTAGTDYHIAVYTYNDADKCYNPFSPAIASFSTLVCDAPATQASAVSADDIDNTTATINWTAGNGDASLVVIKQGSAVDFVPIFATAYTLDQDLGNGNSVAYVGAAVTAAVSSLTQGTEYHIAVFTFDEASQCYNVVDPVRTSFSTTTPLDVDSDIVAPTTQIAAATINSTIDTEGEAVAVFAFQLVDAGTSDAEPTKVSTMVLEKGAANTIADWSTVLEGAVLADGDGAVANATYQINADNITVTFSEGNEYEIADNTTVELTLSVWLDRFSVVQDEILQVTIPTEHSFVALGTGSTIITTLTDAVVGEEFTLNVVYDDIADVRGFENGIQTIVKAIVTTPHIGTTTNTQFYMQDNTAGIEVFRSAVTADIEEGKELVVIGTKEVSSGTTRIVATSISIISSDNALPDVQLVTVDGISVESPLQGSRVRIENATFTDLTNWPSVALTTAGVNLPVSDATGSLEVRIPRNNTFYNAEVASPYGRVDIEGVLGRFNTTLQTFITQSTDVQDNYAPLFVNTTPSLTAATTEGFTINAQLDEPGTIYYVAVARDAAAPSVAQIKAGQNEAGEAALAFGSVAFAVENIGANVNQVITGLADDLALDVYIVAEDLNTNIQAAAELRQISTVSAALDADSEIAAADPQITGATLSSVETNPIEVFAFSIEDKGTQDGVSTTFTALTIAAGAENTANWTNTLATAVLNDGTDDYSATIAAGSLTWDFSGTPYEVVDGTTANFSLFITLAATQTDGAALQFTINQNPTADTEGSQFAEVVAFSSNVHTIDVVATALELESPVSANQDAAFAVTATAVDANGNTDTAARTVSISLTAGDGILSGTDLADQAMTAGVYTFSGLSYDSAEEIQLTVTDGTISEVTSIQITEFDGYNGEGSFEKISAIEDLEAGYYVITATNTEFAMSNDHNGTFLAPTTITVESNAIQNPSTGLVWYIESNGGAYSLYNEATGKYVSYTGSSNNIQIVDEVTSDEQRWTISYADDVFTFVNVAIPTRILQYNSGSPRFVAYTSNQVRFDLYKLAGPACEAPTTQATAVAASAITKETATLNWTAGNGDRSLVVVRQGTAVNFTPSGGAEYTPNTDFAAGTDLGNGNKVVYAGELTTVDLTGLVEGTAYHVAVYTYRASDFCYQAVDPARTNFNTTTDNDTDSDITAPAEQIASTNLFADKVTKEEAVEVFAFDINDKGTADGKATFVKTIILEKGPGNSVANWNNTLAGAVIINASDDTLAVTTNITADKITFTFADGDELSIADGTSESLRLAVWFNRLHVVNESILQFRIPQAHEFTVLGSGSLFTDDLALAVVSNQFVMQTVYNTIAEVRAAENGTHFVVKGIIVGGPTQSSSNRALQDETAGVIIRLQNAATFQVGNEVAVSGTKVTSGTGNIVQLELDQNGVVLNPTVALPEYQVKLITELEPGLGGQLVQVNTVTFTNAGANFAGGGTAGNIEVKDNQENTFNFRVGTGTHPLVGTLIPYGRQNIRGVLTQFNTTLEIQPELVADVIDEYAPLYVSGTPSTTNITKNSFVFSIALDEPGTTYYVLTKTSESAPSPIQVKEGQDASGEPAEMGGQVVIDSDLVSSTQQVLFEDLDPGTSYRLSFLSDDLNGLETSLTTITLSTFADDIDFDAKVDFPEVQVEAKELNSNTGINEFSSVFNFNITDSGTADEVSTFVDKVVIHASDANTADFNVRLSEVKLVDISGDEPVEINASVNVTSSLIEFTPSEAIEVLNGTSKTLQLQVRLATNLVDNQILSFLVPAIESGWSVTSAGTQLSDDFGDLVESPLHTINVEATQLEITLPSSVFVNLGFIVKVTAKDNQGNIDVSTREITLSLESGEGFLDGNLTENSFNGFVDFGLLTYDRAEFISLKATSGDFTIISDEFEVQGAPESFIETFDNSNLTTSFTTGSFEGNFGVVWNYEVSRDEDIYPIDGKGIILRRGSDALLFAEGITGGLGTLKFDYRKGFTGASERQLKVIINEGKATQQEFLTPIFGAGSGAQETIYKFEQEINIAGDFDVKIMVAFNDATGRHATIDNIEWNNFSIDGPYIFVSQVGLDPDFGRVNFGESSDVRSYTVSAEQLTNNLVIAPPVGFEISLTETFEEISTMAIPLIIEPVAGIVEETTIFVRFTPIGDDGQTYSGNISNFSDGAIARDVAVTGIEGQLQVITIAEARALGVGELVKVKGLIISGNADNNDNRAIQDNTAGMILRSTAGDFRTNTLQIGDSVIVSGIVGQFNGLLQISSQVEFEVLSSNNPAPTPKTITLGNINLNTDESTWVTASGLRFVAKASGTEFVPIESGDVFAGATNYLITDDVDSVQFRLGQGSHPVVGSTIPAGEVIYTGYIGSNNGVIQLFVNDANGLVEVGVPTIQVFASAFSGDFGVVELGGSSEIRTYNVGGVELEGDITITPPATFELALSADFSGTVYTNSNALVLEASEGVVANTAIYVRYTPTTADAVNTGNIVHTSTNATTRNLPVSGREGSDPAGAISIAAVKELPSGTNVTVRGIVVGGPNNGSTRWINDGTGGIGFFIPTNSSINLGDSLLLNGDLSVFAQALQIGNNVTAEVLATGRPLPQPVVLTIPATTIADHEGVILRINNLQFVDAPATFAAASANYTLTDGTNEIAFRIGATGHPLAGQDIPTGRFDLVGFLGQNNGNRQLFVNDANGIIVAAPEFTVNAPAAGLDFGTVSRGATSEVLSYTISGENLTSDVNLTASGQFRISTSENDGFVSALSIPVVGGSLAETTIFVRISLNVQTPLGETTGDIQHTVGAIEEMVALKVTVAEVASADKAFANYFKMYPNPTKGILIIENNELFNGSIKSAQLFDLRGAIVKEIPLQAGKNTVEVGNLPNGLYHIVIATENETFRSKLVIVK